MIEFSQKRVFDGVDAYGNRQAEPWLPKLESADREPDFKVRFQSDESSDTESSSLQTAVDRVLVQSEAKRKKKRYIIDIGKGFFEGPLVIPANAPPLLLQGAGAGKTVIAAPIDAKMTGLEYAQRFSQTILRAGAWSKAEFAKITARNHIGTGNTAVVRISSDDVQLSDLTIRNDYSCDRIEAAPAGHVPDVDGRFNEGQHQAVALMLDRADRISVRACCFSSFQDTLYLRTAFDRPCRSAFEECEIEGDVDFIFGGATTHFRKCTILSRGLRGAKSWAVAPSTSIHQAFGFVFEQCNFTHDGEPTGQNGQSFLGRQWFEGVRATPYGIPKIEGYSCELGDLNRFDPPMGLISKRSLESVGKVIITQCRLGAHIRSEKLWDDWASGQWSPRYRPVQHGGADFIRYLSEWLPSNAFVNETISDQIWLSEFNNRFDCCL